MRSINPIRLIAANSMEASRGEVQTTWSVVRMGVWTQDRCDSGVQETVFLARESDDEAAKSRLALLSSVVYILCRDSARQGLFYNKDCANLPCRRLCHATKHAAAAAAAANNSTGVWLSKETHGPHRYTWGYTNDYHSRN